MSNPDIQPDSKAGRAGRDFEFTVTIMDAQSKGLFNGLTANAQLTENNPAQFEGAAVQGIAFADTPDRSR